MLRAKKNDHQQRQHHRDSRSPLRPGQPQDLRRPERRHPARQGHGDHGTERNRQDHAAEAHHAPAPARFGPDPGRRRGHRGPAQARALQAAQALRHAVPERRLVDRPVSIRERGLPAAGTHQSLEPADPACRADQAARGGPEGRRGHVAARTLGWHGAPGRARPCDGHRPRHTDLRRALRGPRPDLDGRHRAPGTANERRAGHHEHRRQSRRRRGFHGLRPQFPHLRRQSRRFRAAPPN